MPDDTKLREQLVELLHGGHAHATFEDTVRDFPLDRTGIRPAGSPHSAWELLEHLRITQKDILDFSRSRDYVALKWPEGYWPKSASPQDGEWAASVRAFEQDRAAFEALVQDETQDLDRAFPWGEGQTLLREALLLADHNSHHLGQLILVRRLVGAWAK